MFMCQRAMCNRPKRVFDSDSSLTREEQLAHPEWVGLKRKLKEDIEFQQAEGVECYI